VGSAPRESSLPGRDTGVAPGCRSPKRNARIVATAGNSLRLPFIDQRRGKLRIAFAFVRYARDQVRRLVSHAHAFVYGLAGRVPAKGANPVGRVDHEQVGLGFAQRAAKGAFALDQGELKIRRVLGSPSVGTWGTAAAAIMPGLTRQTPRGSLRAW